MRILFTLGIVSLIAVANLHASQKVVSKAPVKATAQKQVTKQTKKQLHSSSSSSSSSDSNFAYDGAYTQNIDLDFDFTPPALDTFIDPATGAVIFDTNQPGSPRHIIHPVNQTDFTRFGIEKCGTYLITWSFTIGCAAEGDSNCLTGAFVQLFDA